jgi:hypothetical protein
MFNKEKAGLIEKLNKALGMSHRTKPYDMKKAADLKDALLFAVSAYRDYSHYYFSLVDVDEMFDESLEYYDPASWFYSGNDTEKMDEMAFDAVFALRGAVEAIDKLYERAKEQLVTILKVILFAAPATQKEVLARAYNIEPQDVDTKLDDLLEQYVEVDYIYNMEENRDALLEIMSRRWEPMEQEHLE